MSSNPLEKVEARLQKAVTELAELCASFRGNFYLKKLSTGPTWMKPIDDIPTLKRLVQLGEMVRGHQKAISAIRGRIENKTCQNCGQNFTTHERRRRFCSVPCYQASVSYNARLRAGRANFESSVADATVKLLELVGEES